MKKHLARPLQFFKSVQASSSPLEFFLFRGFLRPERDWSVLDACLNADDMRLVGTSFCRPPGFLENFDSTGILIRISESFDLCQVASIVEMELWFLKDYVAAAEDWTKLYTISTQSMAKTLSHKRKASFRDLALWKDGEELMLRWNLSSSSTISN